MKAKLIFITGGGGYLGSVLVPMLLERGYRARVLDRFFFGKDVFRDHAGHPQFEIIKADSRNYSEKLLQGVDAVVDLAALSNDPLAELDPQLTLDINFQARVRTATLAKRNGVKKYILASSCSVYGDQENLVDETASSKPLSFYAWANIFAEQDTLKLADKNFSVTALRQGTLFGISPRMRFDLVLNTMTLSLFQHGNVSVTDGRQWRPIIHVKDSARAFISALEAPMNRVNKEIFNVGATAHNIRVGELARRITKALNISSQVMHQSGNDHRSYRVSFKKIGKILGFETEYTPEDGCKEVWDALVNGHVSDNLKTKTLEWYKQLLSRDPGLFNTISKN